MTVKPPGYEPVLDRIGQIQVPESWQHQLVMYWKRGSEPFAMRLSERPSRISLRNLFYRASVTAPAFAFDPTQPRGHAEHLDPIDDCGGNFLFDGHQHLSDDALPVPDWMARSRTRKPEPAE